MEHEIRARADTGLDVLEEEQRWSPTHINVTVLRAKGLRAKGKNGYSNPYTIIQLGKEKYRTTVAEKTVEPKWNEECTIRLPPVLDNSGKNTLKLTVMHHSNRLGIPDKFLGRVVFPIAGLFEDKLTRRNKWFPLCSMPNKKAKDRGQLQLAFLFIGMTGNQQEPLQQKQPHPLSANLNIKASWMKYGALSEPCCPHPKLKRTASSSAISSIARPSHTFTNLENPSPSSSCDSGVGTSSNNQHTKSDSHESRNSPSTSGGGSQVSCDLGGHGSRNPAPETGQSRCREEEAKAATENSPKSASQASSTFPPYQSGCKTSEPWRAGGVTSPKKSFFRREEGRVDWVRAQASLSFSPAFWSSMGSTVTQFPPRAMIKSECFCASCCPCAKPL